MRKLFPILLALIASNALAAWLDDVSPIITAREKKAYLGMQPAERERFEQNFFAAKAISSQEYFTRVRYIDANFGSGKPGSGANTDQGRIWLSLGPPARVARIPSSRVFVPLEIWYYNAVPGLLDTELRLIFYQKNTLGFPRLYSPTLDTIRALLLPEASTVHLFGPNDSLSEADIRTQFNVSPAEDEVISAAVNLATGIRYSGNDEILGRIASPATMLQTPLAEHVTARLIVGRPELTVFETQSKFGGSQIDIAAQISARSEIEFEISGLSNSRIHLDAKAAPVGQYTHCLDLLPGSYRAVLTIDGKPYAYAIDVRGASHEILRADLRSHDAPHTPFEFGGDSFTPDPNGRFALLPLSAPGKVTWIIRRGAAVVWRSASDSVSVSKIELPLDQLPQGHYRLEATGAHDSATADLLIRQRTESPAQSASISYNANLDPALRYAFVAHQYILRGAFAEAHRALEPSFSSGSTISAQIEMARLDGLEGHLDESRERLRRILARHPNQFEALSVFAWVEARLQDYAAAADLYRKALAVQDSPALRSALASLPSR